MKTKTRVKIKLSPRGVKLAKTGLRLVTWAGKKVVKISPVQVVLEKYEVPEFSCIHCGGIGTCECDEDQTQ